jgi:hypothetical protein
LKLNRFNGPAEAGEIALRKVARLGTLVSHSGQQNRRTGISRYDLLMVILAKLPRHGKDRESSGARQAETKE